MILPDRVLGRSGTMIDGPGRAMAPSLVATWSRISSRSSSVASLPAAQDDVADDRLTGRVVGRPDDRGLGHGRVVDQRRFDLGGGDAVARHVHHVVDPAEQPDVAVVVDLGAVAGEVPARRTATSRCRGTARGHPRCRAASTATAG